MPPTQPPIDFETAKAKEREAELKAERYTQQHPDGPPSHRDGLLHRLWASLRGRSGT